MTLRNFCIALLVSASVTASAQYDSSQRKFNQYIGIQANQLFKQILNLSNTNTIIDNPYLLNYSINHKNGWGLNFGFGYNYNESNDGNEDNKRENTINDLSYRIGFEHKSFIGKRWLASWGIDFVRDKSSNKTINTVIPFEDNKIITTTDDETKSKGFGPRFSLSYKVSDRIFIGTEATYYFRSGKTSEVTQIDSSSPEFDPFLGQFTGNIITSTTKTETSDKFKRFQFNVPVVLLLIIKF